MQPVDVLLRLGGHDQRMRARIVVRIIERLHRDLKHDLVASLARARDEALQADPIGREGEGHGRGQLGDGVRGHVLAEAKPADQDGHARGRTRPARQRAGRTGVDDRRPGPVGADFREQRRAAFAQ